MRNNSKLKRSVQTAIIFVFLIVIAYLLVANHWTKSIELDSLVTTVRSLVNKEVRVLPDVKLKKAKYHYNDIPDVEAGGESSDVEDQIEVLKPITISSVEHLVQFGPIMPGQFAAESVTKPSFMIDKEIDDKSDLELVTELKQREFETAVNDKIWLVKGPNATIQALKKSVDFVSKYTEKMNIDAFIYLNIVKGRIRLLFRKLLDHKAEFIKGLTSSAVDDLYAILVNLKAVLKKTDDVLRASNSYNENLRSLYAYDLWNFEINRKYFDMLDNPDPNSDSQPPDNPFECISQLIGSGTHNSKPCSVENECWSSMTQDGMKGFPAVQQVFFILIGEAFHCESSMNLRAFTNNMLAYTAYLGRFCSSIYKELIVQSEMKTFDKLCFEQVFMCGLAGYKEFYRPEVLTSLINSQSSTGCYEEETFKTMILKVLINKSSDVCSTSKTSSAIAALAGFLIHSIESSNF